MTSFKYFPLPTPHCPPHTQNPSYGPEIHCNMFKETYSHGNLKLKIKADKRKRLSYRK